MAEAAPVIETDAVIVGAGPVGLFQVFQLGLLEVKARVVDSLPHTGGQCVELYADKPIYDIPGLAVCTGRELTDRLQAQIAPFSAPLHLGQEVTRVEHQADGRFVVETSRGLRFACKAVIVAGGVGAFRARTLKIDGLAGFEGTQLFHQAGDLARFAGQ
jgi:thioredoxin reductase (NADPH)